MNESWNIVTTNNILYAIKNNSKYFKMSLGQSLTIYNRDKDEREIRKGVFTEEYYKKMGKIIHKKGQIGSINFYVDFSLSEEVLGLFKNDYDFLIEYNRDEVNEIGIDNWLSKSIQKADEEIYNLNNKDNINKENVEKYPNNTIIKSPGSATWEDVQKYLNRSREL